MTDVGHGANLLSSYLQIVALSIKRLKFSKDACCLKLILLTPILYIIGFRGALDTGLGRVRSQSRLELRTMMYGFFKTYFCYLRMLTETFRQEGSFSVVVDVGANIGDFTIAMSSRADKIIAIEPGRENFNRLKDNIQRNQIDNVIAKNIAAHDKDEPLALGGNNSDLHVSSSGEPVRGMRLDVLLDMLGIPEIDIVKVDVQGHEEHVLSGLQGLLEKARIRLTIVELHPKRGVSRGSIINKMDSVGYQLVHEDDYLFDQSQLYFRRSSQRIHNSGAPHVSPFETTIQGDLTIERAPTLVRLQAL